MSTTQTTGSGTVVPSLKLLQTVATGMGLIGVIALAFAFVTNPRMFYSSYMFAFVFWGGVTLGACTLTYLHHSIQARWSVAILRILESANKTLPYIFALWLVVVLGLVTHNLYQWGNPDIVAKSEMLQKKEYWLNIPGFIIRGILYFAFWIGTTVFLNNSSRKSDETFDPALLQTRKSFGAPLGVIHILVLTLAITDWVMSLDPVFFSTIYAGIFMNGQVLSNLAIGILLFGGLGGIKNLRPWSEVYHRKVLRDIATVMLGFTMFWTYFTLGQFLIIWSANLPEEIPFFINRFTGGLSIIGGAIVLLQFFVPFTALLSVRLKRDPKLLIPVAALVFIMRVVDVWWQVIPFFRVGLKAADIPSYLLDLGAWAGVGGIWLWLFAANLLAFQRDGVLVVRHDSRLLEEKATEEAHGYV